MPVLTYENNDYILKYVYDGRKASYTFTDHRGKEVTINHLWFHDWNLVHDITEGTMRYHDVFKWTRQNGRHIEAAMRMVDQENYFLFFDGLGHHSNPTNYFANDVLPVFPLTHQQTPAMLVDLVGPSTTKPVFEVNSNGYRCHISVLELSTPSIGGFGVTTKWNKLYNYSYKMDSESFNFFRKTMRESPLATMYGMELEVSTALSLKEIDYIVQHVEPKQEPFFIFKQDGSVRGRFDNCVEMVTVPLSYRYLKRAWKIFFKKLETLTSAKGATIGDYFDLSTDLSNGLHLHVSRESFSSPSHERRFLTMYNQWDRATVDFLTRVSGRPTRHTLNEYCRVDQAYEGRTLARRLRNMRTEDRSVCHNRSGHTLEVRLYQGIFSLDHIFRCIEMTEAMKDYAEFCSLSSISMHFSTHFQEFVSKSAGFRNLKEFFTCVS